MRGELAGNSGSSCRGSSAVNGDRSVGTSGQFWDALRLQLWRLHCRAVTCQSGWPALGERSSFQMGITLELHFGQGGSTCARLCALFICPPGDIDACCCAANLAIYPANVQMSGPASPGGTDSAGGAGAAQVSGMPVSSASWSRSRSWKPASRAIGAGGLLLPVMPVPAADYRRGIVADGKPGLGEVPHFEVVGSAGAAHFRGDPARVDGVASTSGQRRATRGRAP